jgi:hypothetical protein
LLLGKLTIAWASPAPGNQHSEQDSAQTFSQCTRRRLYELGRRHDLKLLICLKFLSGRIDIFLRIWFCAVIDLKNNGNNVPKFKKLVGE